MHKDYFEKKRDEILDKMMAMIDRAQKEDRGLTDEEDELYRGLDAEAEKMTREIARSQKIADMDAKRNVQDIHKPDVKFIPPVDDAEKEWKSFGEFLYCVRFQKNDPRLKYVEPQMTPESRTQQMNVGEDGGFMVPKRFIPSILEVTPEAALFRPRCTIIPAGEESITMPRLNQSAAQNMYGGVTVTWISEGQTKPETGFKLEEFEMLAHEVAAHIVVTDKLLRNWGACEALISRLFRGALLYAEEMAFMSGSGVGKPLGVLKSPARIEIARTTASQIVLADVQAMYARLLGENAIWVATPTSKPYLMNLRDANNNLVWIPNAVQGMPGTLYGLPVRFYNRAPGLGNAGDLQLLDLSYYFIKDGVGPIVAASPHVYFTSNKTVIKVFESLDGQPWLNAPLPLEGSTSDTVSPFVVLK